MSGYYNQPGHVPPYGQPPYDPSRPPDQSAYYTAQGSSNYRPDYSSPSSNPHTGMHPSSYSQGIPYAAAALGATSSSSSSSLGMSISPPHWVPGNTSWGGSGSFVGSFGALGTSYGRERDREIEARYVRDFACCGRQLNGLHDLLEQWVDVEDKSDASYEEEHANLAPDARMAAISAAQAQPPPLSQPMTDVPTPPGMMDIEMDDPSPATFMNRPIKPSYSISAPPSPWATAFRPSGTSTPPQCLPPSLLSYNPSMTVGMRPAAQPITLTTEELQAKALRKAQRKAERAAAREEASTSDIEGEKRFPCPIEGCGKVYKQANGLKYHLTRSINSGHGNVAAMGGLNF